MPGEKKLSEYELPRKYRDLMTNLRISDEQTGGQPVLPAEQVETARAYLAHLLVESRVERAHVRLLEDFYRAKFHSPLGRHFQEGWQLPRLAPVPGFRHNQLLPEERARA